ncbi:MAG: type III-B CRISPR module RAMP protein Cmr1 [Opitutales bacterium]
MKSLTATFRIVTPMFIAGADQSKAELRGPSIKGALRFWWRALQWGKVRDVAELRRKEAELFGSSNGGQSKVLLRLRSFPNPRPIEGGSILNPTGTGTGDRKSRVGEGARYLGYGVMEAFDSKKSGKSGGQLTRPCLPSGTIFELVLSAKEESHLHEIREALIAFGLFGGLGSKARKGYGSVSLINLADDTHSKWEAPKTFEELSEAIKPFVGRNSHHDLPEWTAFGGEDAQILLLQGNEREQALPLLSRIGDDQVFYRSWGRGGKITRNGRDIDSEKRFEIDHDLMKVRANDRRKHPERIAFGLPHNYGKPNDLHVEPAGDLDRRASPLFIHIHQPSEEATPIAVLSFLPARFLPEGANGSRPRISVGGQVVDCAPEAELWKPIQDWLQSLHSGKREDGIETRQAFARAGVLSPNATR